MKYSKEEYEKCSNPHGVSYDTYCKMIDGKISIADALGIEIDKHGYLKDMKKFREKYPTMWDKSEALQEIDPYGEEIWEV